MPLGSLLLCIVSASLTIVCVSSSRDQTAGPVRFQESGSDHVEVSAGERCRLRCPVTGQPRPRIEWLREVNGSLESVLNGSHGGKFRVARGNLLIGNVTQEDEGLYACRIAGPEGTVLKNFTIELVELPNDEPDIPRIPVRKGDKVPPYFTTTLNKLVARPAGTSVELRCPGAGSPTPRLHWLREGEPLLPESRSNGKEVSFRKNFILLEHLSVSDAGKYTCRLTNSEGSVEHTFDLEVKEQLPHRPLFRDGLPSNQTVREGGRARFECRFVSDLHPRLVWLRHYQMNGSYLDANDKPYVEQIFSTDAEVTDPYVLVIDNVTSEHEGYYTCLASNSIGMAFRSAYLNVLTGEEEEEGSVAHTIFRPTSQPHFIVLGVVCFGFLPLCVLIGVLVCRYRLRDKKIPQDRLDMHVVVTKKIVLERRPDESSNSVAPLVKIDYSLSPSPAKEGSLEYEIPLDAEYEFPRDKLVLKEALGQGAFAQVVRAEAHFVSKESPTPVAVKMLKEDHVDSEMTVLVSEMEVMKVIGSHKNIVNLLGCCTQGGPLYLLVEFCAKGNLRDYLRAHRDTFSGYEQPIGVKKTTPNLSLKDLTSFAFQTARGMEYLTSKKCLHRDLACRNVLLTEDDVIKIADFGLARDIHDSDYYKKASASGKLPVKWMAPEAIAHRLYSEKSDVWSFGVTLYEIFTLGGTPFPSVPYEKLLETLHSGHRMAKPENCPLDVYFLMRQCWHYNPSDRPTFSEAGKQLDLLLTRSLDRVYLDLQFPLVSTPENSSSEDEN